MREKIESINILDKSTPITGVPALDSKLETTLEKLRNLEKKSVTRAQGTSTPGQSVDIRGKDSSNKQSPIFEQEPLRSSSLTQILKERYGMDLGKTSVPKPHIDKEYPVAKKHFQGEEKSKYTDFASIRNMLNNLNTGKHSLAESTAFQTTQEQNPTSEAYKAPYEPRSTYPAYPLYENKKARNEPQQQQHQHQQQQQQLPPPPSDNRNRMIVEREISEDNNMEQEVRSAPTITKELTFSYKSLVNESVNKSQDGFEKNSTNKFSPHQQAVDRTRNQPDFSPGQNQYKFAYNTPQQRYPQQQQHQPYQQPHQQHQHQQQQQQQHQHQHQQQQHQQRGDQYRKVSPTPISRGGPRANESTNYDSGSQLSQGKLSQGKQSKGTADYHQSMDRPHGNFQTQEKDFRRPQTTDSQGKSPGRSHSPYTKTPREFMKSPGSGSEEQRGSLINQWIDQKVNGYLVFQNTLRDQAGQVDDFTSYATDQWFQLSKPERDEYTVLALSIRADLKQEFKDMALSSSELSQIQQILDERIKQVKK